MYKYLDENWACRLALDQSRNNGNGLIADDIDKHHWLHQWSYLTYIGYICIVPDNDYICTMTKIYFRELSTHYELCRLGSHRPLLKAFSDQGLLRISSQQYNDSSQLPNIDSWFTDHETTHPLGSRLKLYAQIFKDKLCKKSLKLSYY
ncbi:unnamed protein product [Rotaria sp. Silwood2]|nr:unnamed protein product [Rotaria sp. Silwood2]